MCVADALSVILRYPLGGKSVELAIFIVVEEAIGKAIVVLVFVGVYVVDLVIYEELLEVVEKEEPEIAVIALACISELIVFAVPPEAPAPEAPET